MPFMNRLTKPTSCVLQLTVEPVFCHIAPMLQAITHRSPVIVEIGMHDGKHSALLHVLCRRPPLYFGFEPDPRNVEILQNGSWSPFVEAVSDACGVEELHLSGGSPPGSEEEDWTASSSLQEPTLHREVHPWCTFHDTETVETVTLDVALPTGMDAVDLIWCDVQGAQRKVITGAKKTLQRTRYLYIECHPVPMYEGEPTFEELCALLPDFDVLERYEADVLFRRKESDGG